MTEPIACPLGCYPCADTYPQTGEHAGCCCGGGACCAPQGVRQKEKTTAETLRDQLLKQVRVNLQQMVDQEALARVQEREAEKQRQEAEARAALDEQVHAGVRAAHQAREQDRKRRKQEEAIRQRVRPKLVDYTPAQPAAPKKVKQTQPERVR